MRPGCSIARCRCRVAGARMHLALVRPREDLPRRVRVENLREAGRAYSALGVARTTQALERLGVGAKRVLGKKVACGARRSWRPRDLGHTAPVASEALARTTQAGYESLPRGQPRRSSPATTDANLVRDAIGLSGHRVSRPSIVSCHWPRSSEAQARTRHQACSARGG